MKPTRKKPVTSPESPTVVDLSRTETLIKDKIMNDALNNVDKEETRLAVLAIIDKYIETLKTDAVLYRNSLKVFARKIFKVAEQIRAIEPVPKYVSKRDVRAEMIQVDKTTVFVSDYDKRVKEITNAILSIEPMIGKSSARIRAEMSVRNEAIQKDLERLRNEGVKIVIVSTHSNCSERCADWQGKVYSLDGTKGRTIDGREYQPLEIAVAGKNNDGNGLFGYNCRHRAYEYKLGMKPPVEFTEKQMIAGRKIDQTMRNYERELRKLHQAIKIGATVELRNQARVRYKELYAEYDTYANRNNMAIQPWRTKA